MWHYPWFSTFSTLTVSQVFYIFFHISFLAFPVGIMSVPCLINAWMLWVWSYYTIWIGVLFLLVSTVWQDGWAAASSWVWGHKIREGWMCLSELLLSSPESSHDQNNHRTAWIPMKGGKKGSAMCFKLWTQNPQEKFAWFLTRYCPQAWKNKSE